MSVESCDFLPRCSHKKVRALALLESSCYVVEPISGRRLSTLDGRTKQGTRQIHEVAKNQGQWTTDVDALLY